MNKKEFLEAIRDRLKGLPEDEIKKSLDYYQEMIDDYIEDGMSEEQALKEIGTVDEIVSQILMNVSLPKLVKEKVRPKHKVSAFVVILLSLGSPIWLPLLLVAISIFLVIYIIIWSIVCVMYCIDFCFAAYGIAAIAFSAVVISTGKYFSGLFTFGTGLISIGVAILLFFAFNKATSCFVKLSKLIILKAKSMFLKRGDVR